MQYSAKFVVQEAHRTITVFCHDNRTGWEFVLGYMDEAEPFGYDGFYVFNLDMERIIAQTGWESFHIPVNVLREIADFAPTEA
ncbi:MAG: hypothetical protein ABSB87_13735 [Terriglobales bacterium]|jgi:hypothetical protein